MSTQSLTQIIKTNKLFFGALFILVFVVFVNGITGEFISDDIQAIRDSNTLASFGQNLKSLNIHDIISSAIFNLFGRNPTAFHVRSVLFHFINLTIFFTFVAYIRNQKEALIATILYTVHPLVTEAVTWISGTAYIYLSIFFWAGLLSYEAYIRNKNKRALLVLACILTYFVFAHWPAALPFPVMLIVYLLLIQKQKKDFRFVVVFVIFSILMAVNFYRAVFTTGQAQDRIDSLKNPESPALINRYSYSVYSSLELLIFPNNLTLYHEGEVLTPAKMNFMVFVTALFLGIIIILLFKNKELAGWIIVGFGSMAPVFSPVQVAWFVADRYHYFFVGVFTMLLARLFFNVVNKKPELREVLYLLLGLLFVIYTARTIVRNADWQTGKKLWHATQKKSPYSYRVYNNLGDAYASEGNYAEAIKYFAQSVKLQPNYADAMHNLGHTYLAMRDLENAEMWFKKSLEYNPNIFQSWYKLGLIEAERKNYPLAIDYLQKAYTINPNLTGILQIIEKLQAEELKSSQ